MGHEHGVRVVHSSGRKYYLLRYHDPITGVARQKSSGVEATGLKRDRVAAERVAAELEADLRNGRYSEPSKVSWQDFRNEYEEHALAALAETTERKAIGVLNSFETVIRPARLVDVTEQKLVHYQSALRKLGRSENTIRGHLAHLSAALNWAVEHGLMVKAPSVKMPKRSKRTKAMKGRPITTEEFERMLAVVPKVVGEAAAASWRHYLRGLWVSGLRLAESTEVFWDRDDKLCIDLLGDYPMLRIPAELEKGHRDRMLPITPDFAEFLEATPEGARAGHVFAPQPLRSTAGRLQPHRVGELVSMIGKAANVVVSTDRKTGRVKFASAHDLRRSFGQRWSLKVTPTVLMTLMRHESIDTTLRHYLQQDAEATAAAVWEASKSSGKVTLEVTEQQNHRPSMKKATTESVDSSWLTRIAEEGLEPPTRGL